MMVKWQGLLGMAMAMLLSSAATALADAAGAVEEASSPLPTPQNAALMMEDELAKARAAKVDESTMYRWARYCWQHNEAFNDLRKWVTSDGKLTRAGRRFAIKKGKSAVEAEELAASITALLPSATEISTLCEELTKDALAGIKRRQGELTREVAAWRKQHPDLESLDEFWGTWNALYDEIERASAEDTPEREGALRLKKKLHSAWQGAWKKVRSEVAKTLYVAMLRNGTMVDKVAAVGSAGSTLSIVRSHCEGIFAAILMERFEVVFEEGAFAEVRCTPKHGHGRLEGFTIPLLEEKAPGMK